MGPRVDPWGTPHESVPVDEENPPVKTERICQKGRSEQYP